MRIVCLSDTHSKHDDMIVPDGDLLLIAGDVTHRGKLAEVEAFSAWVAQLPHRHKVMIAGNHDFLFEEDPAAHTLIPPVTYLNDDLIELNGLRIYGNPWGPWLDGWAFRYERGDDGRAMWQKLPAQVDILLTHTPPYRILDTIYDGRNVGCRALQNAVMQLKPRLHLFGHIHEDYGQQEIDGIHFVNASICNRQIEATHPAIVIDW